MDINLKNVENTTLIHVAETKLQKFLGISVLRTLIPMYVAKRIDDKILLHRASLGLFKNFIEVSSGTSFININDFKTVKERDLPFESIKSFMNSSSPKLSSYSLSRYIIELRNGEVLHILVYDDQSSIPSDQNFSNELDIFLMKEAKKYKL